MNEVPLKRDGTPTVPLCVDCANFNTGGIGIPPTCSSPKRKGDFDPVYGWKMLSVDPYVARNINNDCGVAGNFFEPKVSGMWRDKISPTFVEVKPQPKPRWWERFTFNIFDNK